MTKNPKIAPKTKDEIIARKAMSFLISIMWSYYIFFGLLLQPWVK